jgi:hypothetical protein
MELTQLLPSVPWLYVPTPGPPAGGWVYLLAQDAGSTPRTIAFADSWNAFDGAYLFLPQPLAPGTEAEFVATAWAFLGDRRLSGTRLAWVQPPRDGGPMEGVALQVAPAEGPGTRIAFGLTIPFGSLGLFLDAGSAVSQDEANVAFVFTGTGTRSSRLRADWGTTWVGAPVSTVTLPLTGSLAGCLQLTLRLGLDDLDTLDVGLRFFYAVPPDAAHAADFFLDSLRYPLFAEALTLYANLDPLAVLAADRTFLAFDGADAGQPIAGPAPAVGSHLRDTLGRAIWLRPLRGSDAPSAFAALVPASNRQSSAPSVRDPLYLVPRGDFVPTPTSSQPQATGLDSQPGATKLMCGLSGVEYAELSTGAILSFFPGAPAFAAGFIPGEPAGATSLAPAVAPSTAFASLATPGDFVDYFAQPDQSVLYNYPAQPTEGAATVVAEGIAVTAEGVASVTAEGVTAITPLAPVPVLAASVPWPPTESLRFPLLPYGGLDGGPLAAHRQLEGQIASPMRRAALAAAKPQARTEYALAAPAASRCSTTPQGLLATYVPGAPEWEEIVLAQMTDGKRLALHKVRDELLAAFQTNKLFLVATSPSALSSLAPPDAQIAIGATASEAWSFDLDPATWAEHGTILILKFSDVSIAELARQPSAWASPKTFNASPERASQAILAAIAAATDSDFAAFLAAVNEPSWNGVLALNVHAPLTQLPAQLAGLAVGIEQSAFAAHHVGIRASKIEVPQTPGELTISDSSIFGLIDYTAPAPLPPRTGDFAFQVKRLKVLFLSSAVASFSSVIDLQVDTLFGEPAQLAGSTDNTVELHGLSQRHVAGGQVTESYTFQTEPGQLSAFAIASQVLDTVVLSGGQFVTVADGATATVARFQFAGLLDFRALPFDVFSFGRASPTAAPAGLSFANLVVEMSFDPRAVPPVASFRFDASALALDPATSQVRPDGFFQRFPLKVASLTQATPGTTPTGLGYMSVQTPLTQSELTYPWYALNFDLDLGSPGALAARVGFVAGLTAAWSPKLGGGYTVFTGLKLPGSSGAKRQISIEGVFDVAFKTIEILAPAPDTYVLVLYGIAFEFLRISFPPSGQVNFALLGDPASAAKGDTTLAWYAAYAKADAKQAPATARAGLTPAPRALLLAPEGLGLAAGGPGLAAEKTGEL